MFFVILASLAVGGFYSLYSFHRKKGNEANLVNKTVFALSSADLAMNDFSGISTVTYYNGKLPIEFLKNRTFEILKANPWLASKLVTVVKGVVAVYPPSEEIDIDAFFKVAHVPTLKNGTSFEDASQLLYAYQVRKGKDCIDKDEALFKVSVITTDDPHENMLVVSLSHTLGDGFTFYKIYSMFEKKPTAMIVQRVETFNEDLKKTMGPDTTNFMLSPGTIIGIVSNVASAKHYPIRNKDVDKELIEKEKQKYFNGTDFVSTNDVITSWAFNMTECRYGMMALNLRNRVKSVTNDHAGNYEGSLIFKPDYSPLTIRNAVKALKVQSLPSFWDGYSGNNTVVSNWSSFHHDLVLPNGNHGINASLNPLKPVNHHPLEGDKVFLVKCTAIIYKPTIDRIAVLYGDTNPTNKTLNIFK
jgi:hypothetical protein